MRHQFQTSDNGDRHPHSPCRQTPPDRVAVAGPSDISFRRQTTVTVISVIVTHTRLSVTETLPESVAVKRSKRVSVSVWWRFPGHNGCPRTLPVPWPGSVVTTASRCEGVCGGAI